MRRLRDRRRARAKRELMPHGGRNTDTSTHSQSDRRRPHRPTQRLGPSRAQRGAAHYRAMEKSSGAAELRESTVVGVREGVVLLPYGGDTDGSEQCQQVLRGTGRHEHGAVRWRIDEPAVVGQLANGHAN